MGNVSHLLFRNLEGDGRAYSAPIADGRYSVEVETGKMRVEITASRIVPGKFSYAKGEKDPVGEKYIPARYNSRSELDEKFPYRSRGSNPYRESGTNAPFSFPAPCA